MPGKKSAAAKAAQELGAVVEKLSPKYLKLLKAFRLRPITSDGELDAATKLVNELALRDDLDPDEQDYFDVLTDLIEAYEDVHHAIAASPPHRILKSLMDEHQVTQTKLAKETGLAISTINEILAEKRKMSTKHISAIAKFFNVNPSVFLP